MKVISDKAAFDRDACVATIGVFDGVHKGHQFLINQVKQLAQERKMASLLITFPIPPRKVLQPEFQPQLLTTVDEKVRLLTQTGADKCLLLPFTKELSQKTAQEFMQLLHDFYGVKVLVIGHDHRFGRNRAEGFDDYVRYGEQIGMQLVQAEALVEGGQSISSSLARKCLLENRPEEAAHHLGYNYRLAGVVVHGYQMGRTLGFPTANLRPVDDMKLVPGDGIYAVYVWLNGERYKGMLDIGYRPTMQNGNDRTIEVNILDFDRDIYGETIELEFVKYLRADVKFDRIEDLIAKLEDDRRQVVALLN